MNNKELLERINAAITSGAANADLLKECWQRIADMDQRLDNIAESCASVRGNVTYDALRGQLEEIEAMATAPFDA